MCILANGSRRHREKLRVSYEQLELHKRGMEESVIEPGRSSADSRAGHQATQHCAQGS